MPGSSLFDRLVARGAPAQAAIAGGYAWAVTVAPTVWERGAPAIALVAAGVGLAALLALAVGDRLWGGRGRAAALWVFVLASALAWLSAPAALRPTRLDTTRGLAGMAGWALFALASAGPALGERQEPGRVVDDAPLEARRCFARGDVAYPLVGGAVALGLQVVGTGRDEPRARLARAPRGSCGGPGHRRVAAEIASHGTLHAARDRGRRGCGPSVAPFCRSPGSRSPVCCSRAGADIVTTASTFRDRALSGIHSSAAPLATRTG